LLIKTNPRQERKYFDSGDFALSQAGKASDTGVTLQTGKKHPLVESISHLSSPVPSDSNVNQDANRSYHKEMNKNPTEAGSHLHQQENADKEVNKARKD